MPQSVEKLKYVEDVEVNSKMAPRRLQNRRVYRHHKRKRQKFSRLSVSAAGCALL